jgi:hypothetical protein
MNLHPACARAPEYWEGRDDALAGRAFCRSFWGVSDYFAREYRAGYLGACVEAAKAGRVADCPPEAP